jgi:hypothetical protein
LHSRSNRNGASSFFNKLGFSRYCCSERLRRTEYPCCLWSFFYSFYSFCVHLHVWISFWSSFQPSYYHCCPHQRGRKKFNC